MLKKLLLSILTIIAFGLYSCCPEDDLPMPTCSDGIMNGYEKGIDCGATCKHCIIATWKIRDFILEDYFAISDGVDMSTGDVVDVTYRFEENGDLYMYSKSVDDSGNAEGGYVAAEWKFINVAKGTLRINSDDEDGIIYGFNINGNELILDFDAEVNNCTGCYDTIVMKFERVD